MFGSIQPSWKRTIFHYATKEANKTVPSILKITCNQGNQKSCKSQNCRWSDKKIGRTYSICLKLLASYFKILLVPLGKICLINYLSSLFNLCFNLFASD